MPYAYAVLDRALSAKLARRPENGMGYHIADLLLRDGRVLHDVVILGGETVVLPDHAGLISGRDILDLV